MAELGKLLVGDGKRLDIDERVEFEPAFLRIDAAGANQPDQGSPLCSHPAILRNPEWYRLAAEAQEALWNLYQAIGDKHMDA